MNPKFAILLDGGFVTKTLGTRNRTFPTTADIVQECERIKAHSSLAGHDLLRIYYDAPPSTSNLTNPIDGSALDLGATTVFRRSVSLLDQLEMEKDFAVRKGEIVARGWKIGKAALTSMLKSPRVPTARDLQPNVQQKSVDLRIGLDIALLSLRRLANAIVVVTGDSDLIPAFKFARREGMRVYLDHLGGPVRRELKVHADIVF